MLKEAELCFVMLWEVMGEGGGDETLQAFLFKCNEFAMLGGEEPLSNVASYCTCTLSNAILRGTTVAGSKICNGGEPIPADPDPSGRCSSETGPRNGNGL